MVLEPNLGLAFERSALHELDEPYLVNSNGELVSGTP